MVEWYHSVYDKARKIEGAAQRVQEDTIKFSRIMESLGTSLIEAVMLLIEFTPILIGLSRKSLIEELSIDNFKSRGINKKSINPSKRLSGSIAFAMHAINNGVQIIRTHDVFETNQALICQRALI